MRSERAIVFTHITASPREADTIQGARAIVERTRPYFRSYLQCRNIGLVYAYVDHGLKEVVHLVVDAPQKTVQYPLGALESEERIRNCLKIAVDTALRDLSNDPQSGFDRSEAPRFQFIGLPHLVSLLNALLRIDSNLVRDLGGPDNTFTYDSPKFVDAVIRIVRGGHDSVPHDPILRFDQDVAVNEQGVNRLMNEVVSTRNFHSYYFFSGRYGRLDLQEDAVNDYAVRTNWLVDLGNPRALPSGGAAFLRDLGEVGATQVPTATRPSAACLDKLAAYRGGGSVNRPSPQEISGAGLVMSVQSIRRLPPFMNARHPTVWVDDLLKRRLHEAIDDIAPSQVENVESARFEQDRHPGGLRPEHAEWTRQNYFERLLRGCLVHALITAGDRGCGPLGRVVKDALDGAWHEVPSATEQALRAEMRQCAADACERVLHVWRRADYGVNLLRDWCQDAQRDFVKVCHSSVEDAIAYLRLVTRWQDYVAAIEALSPHQAYWLFKQM